MNTNIFKQTFKTVAYSALALAVLSGCSKEFLETEPGQYISDAQLKKLSEFNPNIQQSNLLGTYSIMTMVESGGLPGNQTDFGQKGLDIYADMLIGDICKPVDGFGWYGSVLEYKATVDNRNLANYMPWRYYYRVIFSSNAIIDVLGGNDAKFDDTKLGTTNRHIYAQAIAMRAYAYFYLGQFFAPEYQPKRELCPMYLSRKELNLSLSTMETVYGQVVKDLKTAIAYLGDFTRENKSAIDMNVAKGLLAYTYAAMGQYDEVKKLAREVIDSGAFVKMSGTEIVYNPTTQTGSGFNNVKIPGWMWATDITPEHSLDLVSWWGQMDIFTYSYPSVGAIRSISNALYDAIRPDDVRKGQFSTDTNYLLAPSNKFFTPSRTVQGQRVIETDYLYMRVSEMYMLEIEALAFTGNEAEAKAKLKDFLSDRITDTSYIDNLSGAELKAEIQFQWRLEFWGEGKAYLAAKRFKNPIVLGTNRYDTQNAGLKLPYNDERLYYKIPSNEELNNPYLHVKK